MRSWIYVFMFLAVMTAVSATTINFVSDSTTKFSYDYSTWYDSVPTYVYPSWPTIDGSTWIWSSYHVTADEAQNGSGLSFQKAVELPSCAKNIKASITIDADNWFFLSLNGDFVNQGMDWTQVQTFDLNMVPGTNTLDISAVKVPLTNGNWQTNPAGLAFSGTVTYDGCACTDGQTQQCGTSDVGECHYGVSTCSDGEWGSCVGNVEPVSEVCGDGKDNNCDGNIDEGNVCAPPAETQCSDGIDNDGNGLIDCADPNCANDSACVVGKCTDTDNGKDIWNAGITTDDKGANLDSCDGASNNLKEWYCDGSTAKHDNIKCTDFNAVCVEPNDAPAYCQCSQGYVFDAQQNTCVEPQVPEFGIIGAALALVSAIGIFVVRRKK